MKYQTIIKLGDSLTKDKDVLGKMPKFAKKMSKLAKQMTSEESVKSREKNHTLKKPAPGAVKTVEHNKIM